MKINKKIVNGWVVYPKLKVYQGELSFHTSYGQAKERAVDYDDDVFKAELHYEVKPKKK